MGFADGRAGGIACAAPLLAAPSNSAEPRTGRRRCRCSFASTARLELERLRTALRAVVERHEVLRSRFRWREERLLVDLIPAAGIDLPIHGSGGAMRFEEADIVRATQELADLPFSLEHGPLVRAAIFANGPQQTYLALVVHHIVWDGWSNAIVLRDLAAAYEAGGALAPLPARYWDYGALKRRWIAAHGEQDAAYWRAQLEGVTELPPLAHAEPGGGGADEIRRLQLELEPSLLERVAAFGGPRNATPFCVFAAALQALLHRRGLGGDSCLGIPMADRTDPRFEQLAGCFVNTVVLRGRVREADTFEQLVARTRETAYEAIAHGGLPFELMVQRLEDWAASCSAHRSTRRCSRSTTSPRRRSLLPASRPLR